MSEALANVGATLEHIDAGQSLEGAPKAPTGHNPNGSGDDVKPVEKPKAEPKPKADPAVEESAVEEDEKPAAPVEYVQVEDEHIADVIDVLKDSGLSPAESEVLFAKAMESGDIKDIDMKALTEAVGAAKARMILSRLSDWKQTGEATNKEAEALRDEVHEMFGGESGWETVRGWAQKREAKDPEFKKFLDGVRSDIGLGGRAAKAAAADLLSAYNGNPRTKGIGNQNLIRGEGKPAPTASPMTRSAYVEALKEAHARGAKPAEIAQLDARRTAGKKAGI